MAWFLFVLVTMKERPTKECEERPVIAKKSRSCLAVAFGQEMRSDAKCVNRDPNRSRREGRAIP